jgi:hypothetical protein
MKPILIFFLLSYLGYADIDKVEILSNSSIVETTIKNHSDVTQGNLNIDESSLNNSNFTLYSSIDDAEISNSIISQSAIYLENSLIGNSDITTNSSISNGSGNMYIIDATLIQGKINLQSSSINNSKIAINSSIENSTIENATVNQCSLYLGSRATLSNKDIHGSCSMKNSKIRGGVNLTQALMIFDN